ncbi:MAG: AMP-binding protein [Deltaproteobacteria bacterium]|nr:MAG: AMP-binding protein [Deltaproteobacteria bacterium]
MEKQDHTKVLASGSGSDPDWVSATTLGDMFDQTAESSIGEAVVFPKARISYPELSELSNRYARALMGLGIGRLDKVGIMLPAGIDYIALLLAIFKAGAIAVPINGRFKEIEIRHVVNKSDMKFLFTSSDISETIDYAGLVSSAFPSFFNTGPPSGKNDSRHKLAHAICFSDDTPKGFISRGEFEELAKSVEPSEFAQRRMGVRIRDTAVLMFTSGTTAKPKAAMLSHEALSRVAWAISKSRYMMTSEDRLWTPLALFHIGGIAFSLTCFSVGATFCHCGFFSPEVALKQLSEERCTIAIPAFETIWLAVTNLPQFASTDLSSIRIIHNVGTPERLRQMQAGMPHAIQTSNVGATESSSFLSLHHLSDPLETRLTTGGHPLPGMEVCVIDPVSGANLGPNQRGELLYRGPHLFDGYYNDSEVTLQSIDEEGWFHSGDLAEMDEDGRITFKGRLKDMLKVGGENVAAEEIEAYLIRHPAVLIAQVVAAPDSRYIEVPAAYLQLKEGASATQEEIIDFCLGKIATFKVPRYVRFVKEWPMSASKIKKFVLRDQIAAELKQAGITEAPKPQAIVGKVDTS